VLEKDIYIPTTIAKRRRIWVLDSRIQYTIFQEALRFEFLRFRILFWIV